MLPLQIIQKLSSNEKGMILITLKDEIHQFIGDVYYISMVKNNILSLRQLLKKRYMIKMKDRILTLLGTKGDMIVKVAMIKNRMFLLEMDVPKCMCER
jgi:hypothetical protein